MYGYYGFYWDPTYYLVVIGAIICLIASARVKGTFNRLQPRAQCLRYDGGTGGRAHASQIRYL